MKRILTTITILTLFFAGKAQNNDRVITTAVPFLLIASEARSSGMGDMGVATAPDAFSQQWNASKYVFAKKQIGVAVGFTPYLSDLVDDIFLGNVTYYKRNENSAWGGSLRYFTLGEIDFTTLVGNDVVSQGAERPNELAIDVSYSLKLNEGFSMGVAGRFLRSDLRIPQSNGSSVDAGAASTFAVDITGFYMSPEKAYESFNGRWRGGFAISNLGPKLSYDDGGTEDFLPTKLALGGGFDFIFDDYNKLAVTLETTKLLVPTPSIPVDASGVPVADSGNPIRGFAQEDQSFLAGVFSSFGDAPDGFSEELQEFTWSLGAEYLYQDSFAFRAGYFNESEEKGSRKFFSLGAGFKYNLVNVDLSYLFSASRVRNPLENTLRFSLTFNLGEDYDDY